MSFEELIPFLIAAVVLVARALGNSNKKKQTTNRPVSHPFPEEVSEDAYDDVREKDPRQVLFDMFGIEGEERKAVPTVETVEESQDDQETVEEGSLYSQYKLPSLEMEDVTQMADKLEAMRDVEGKQTVSPEVTRDASFWDDEEFDMRRAVIYSEILRPKYAD